MQRIAQAMAALALLVTGGFWVKNVQATDVQPVAKSGSTNPWPFGDKNRYACAFCSGRPALALPKPTIPSFKISL